MKRQIVTTSYGEVSVMYIGNDRNGNCRYAVYFRELLTPEEKAATAFDAKAGFALAVSKAYPHGGKPKTNDTAIVFKPGGRGLAQVIREVIES